jgi:hypothetical protein
LVGIFAHESPKHLKLRTVWQPGFIALFSKPAAKCGSLERSTTSGGHEGQMITRCGRDNGLKSRVQRNDQTHARLLLLDVEGVVADVLRPHAENIAASLPGIEEERQCQPGTGSCRMMPLELQVLSKNSFVPLMADAIVSWFLFLSLLFALLASITAKLMLRRWVVDSAFFLPTRPRLRRALRGKTDSGSADALSA